jgi:hypothetical protein
MATEADLERVVRRVLNEGTAYGQKNWAGTSKATLRAAQHLANLINQKVIPRLGPQATESVPPLGAGREDEDAVEDVEDLAEDAAEDVGVQRLNAATTDDERLALEASLLVETDNGPHDDEDAGEEDAHGDR